MKISEIIKDKKKEFTNSETIHGLTRKYMTLSSDRPYEKIVIYEDGDKARMDKRGRIYSYDWPCFGWDGSE